MGWGEERALARGEWQGPSIVSDQCEPVSIAIETGATLGRHAFISTTGSPLAIRGQINPPGCSVYAFGGLERGGANMHTHTLKMFT